MLGSVVLDVAIGMAFTYLLLSLIASAIQEILAALVQSRAANLQRGIRSLLSGDSIEAGSKLIDGIYNHGLVRGLYEDPLKDYGQLQGKLSRVRLRLQRLVRIAPPMPVSGVADPMKLPSYIPARTFALALTDLLNHDKLNGKPPLQNIRDYLTADPARFRGNKAVEALLALVLDAKEDANKFQANLENWYNDAMDRVSGWYKRYTQAVLLIIGLLLSVSFNVDSVRVARILWLDRDMRQGMVDAAHGYLAKYPEGITSSHSTETGPPERDLARSMRETVGAFKDVAATELLPVGWRYPPTEYWKSLMRRPHLDALARVLQTLGGWCITAVALSLGAPFWFDILNKFMVVRSTIKPQEKSQNEASKDK